jgi:hypothetical protein
MSVMRRLADRVLARMVPEEPAGACSERTCCDALKGRKTCYYGCGRPTWCTGYYGECAIGEGFPSC